MLRAMSAGAVSLTLPVTQATLASNRAGQSENSSGRSAVQHLEGLPANNPLAEQS